MKAQKLDIWRIELQTSRRHVNKCEACALPLCQMPMFVGHSHAYRERLMSSACNSNSTPPVASLLSFSHFFVTSKCLISALKMIYKRPVCPNH